MQEALTQVHTLTPFLKRHYHNLLTLSLLLADEEVNLQALSALVPSDMALAAADHLSLRFKLPMAGGIRLYRRTAGQHHAVNAGRAF